jgi:hypothetical protein
MTIVSISHPQLYTCPRLQTILQAVASLLSQYNRSQQISKQRFMSAIDTYSSELKPTTERQTGEEQKRMTRTKILANIQPPPLFLYACRNVITDTIKKFAKRNCQRRWNKLIQYGKRCNRVLKSNFQLLMHEIFEYLWLLFPSFQNWKNKTPSKPPSSFRVCRLFRSTTRKALLCVQIFHDCDIRAFLSSEPRTNIPRVSRIAFTRAVVKIRVRF